MGNDSNQLVLNYSLSPLLFLIKNSTHFVLKCPFEIGTFFVCFVLFVCLFVCFSLAFVSNFVKFVFLQLWTVVSGYSPFILS
jgi:hypothetical protein